MPVTPGEVASSAAEAKDRLVRAWSEYIDNALVGLWDDHEPADQELVISIEFDRLRNKPSGHEVFRAIQDGEYDDERVMQVLECDVLPLYSENWNVTFHGAVAHERLESVASLTFQAKSQEPSADTT